MHEYIYAVCVSQMGMITFYREKKLQHLWKIMIPPQFTPQFINPKGKSMITPCSYILISLLRPVTLQIK